MLCGQGSSQLSSAQLSIAGKGVGVGRNRRENYYETNEPSGDPRARPQRALVHIRLARRRYQQRRTVEHQGLGQRASFQLC